MQVRDCLSLHTDTLSAVSYAAAQFYDSAQLRTACEQFLFPDYAQDGPAAALEQLCASGSLFVHGSRSAGKTGLLLAAGALLSGHDGSREILLKKLGTAVPDTYKTLEPLFSKPGLVLALDGRQLADTGLLHGIREAGERALLQHGLSSLCGDSVSSVLENLTAQIRTKSEDAGVAVLIDDFDQYLTPSVLRRDAADLRALLSADTMLVLFSRQDRDTLIKALPKAQQSETDLPKMPSFRLHCCLETIIGSMLTQTDEENFNQMVGRFIRQKDHYFYTHFCQIRRWGKQIPSGIVWQNYDLFLTNVTFGCYPLHPFTVYILSLLLPFLQHRSFTEPVLRALQSSMDQEFVRVWPPFVYPISLLDDAVCEELLTAEAEGLIQNHLASNYKTVREKLGDKLSAYESSVLSGIFLILVCKLSYVDKTDLTEIISKCTGIYKSEEIDNAFHTLEDEYGAIAYDTAKNEVTIPPEPCGRKDFERQRSRALLRCGRLNCVRDCDEYLLSRLQINVPVETGFAQQKGISSSEWQWDKEFIHLDQITEEELALRKKAVSTRHNVAEHRGLLMCVYCPEDSSESVSRLCGWYKKLRLDECAIELILLKDIENRFRNGVRDWNILKRFTAHEQEYFRRYYDEGVKAAENMVIGAFHQMAREQVYAKAAGPVSISERIDVYLTRRFSELFPKAPPFCFDGFERKLTNQIRNNYVSVVTKLMDDTITNPKGYQSLSEGLRGRINNCFLTGVPHSWQVLNKNCELVEPQNPQILEIFLMAEDDLLNGALTVGRLFRNKLYAPYGMNEYSLGLLICLFMVYNRNRIEITSNGVPLRPENVVSLFILKTKIRFSELFAMKLTLKTLSEDKEILHACDEVASNRYVENCGNLKEWLTGLVENREVSEAVKERVDRALERLDAGQALYDRLYQHVIDSYLQDMNSDKPAIRCLAAARIQEAFGSLEGEIEPGSGYYYSPQFARVVTSMKARGDTLLNRFFHSEMNKLDCTVAFWERFRKQYLELAEALVQCGRMDETYQLLHRLSEIEKKVGGLKAAQNAEKPDPESGVEQTPE